MDDVQEKLSTDATGEPIATAPATEDERADAGSTEETDGGSQATPAAGEEPSDDHVKADAPEDRQVGEPNYLKVKARLDQVLAETDACARCRITALISVLAKECTDLSINAVHALELSRSSSRILRDAVECELVSGHYEKPILGSDFLSSFYSAPSFGVGGPLRSFLAEAAGAGAINIDRVRPFLQRPIRSRVHG